MISDVTKEEIIESHKLSTIYCNKFIIHKTATVKIVFAEKSPFCDLPFYRSSVFLSIEDAKELAKVLNELLNKEVAK